MLEKSIAEYSGSLRENVNCLAMRIWMLGIWFLLAPAIHSERLEAQTREEIVRGDRKKVEAEGFWIYNNLDKAFETAKETGKPIVVVLRCLPCHECVKLDDDLIDRNPKIRPLLEKFVCARQVSTNGLDLDLFQYDTDQSFAVFFLNADKTIYGRFGTRSHRTEWIDDVSVVGLANALKKTLELHQNYDQVKKSLLAKTGKPMEVAAPELFPSLQDRFTSQLNYEGDVVKSCIHCHQIGDAQREFYWHVNKPIPQKVLYPFPHPKSIGLVLDPSELALVKEVAVDSPAEAAGLKVGDQIDKFDGQPILSIADVQWVLHNISPGGGTRKLTVTRGGQSKELTIELKKDWRLKGDISWRVTSWGLRRIATGGLLLEQVSNEERSRLEVPEGQMALRVKHAGQYGLHATAHRKGIRKGDILVEFDGKKDLLREQDVHTYVVSSKKPGDNVTLRIMRNAKVLSFELPIQK